ncbi:DUF4179 domain-containing protein [Paenibacillus chitinolyticus]|uniref:DUF4179 domain-containing protein n=1 Tax=Paenibacillus chitinolyticus TaxID=79263 RepID=UPI001C4569D2|nr:DUF4179 domain-containing protein [Paenibacillus chitinolyticus]MBV6715735.1 DUF4179 domain-containing protein [Paenibacillus chitinolyticus]
MKSDHGLKQALDKSFDNIAVPESLYQFAGELPEKFDAGELEHTPAPGQAPSVRPRRYRRVAAGSAAAAVLVLVFSFGVKMSPAFASFVKGVPGFQIAVDWLTDVRKKDGVQNAIDNGYSPIEPVTKQFGGTTITIGDIYLTEEELIYKVFVRTDEFDVSDEDRNMDIWVTPRDLPAGGSRTSASVTTEGNKPVRQETYKFQLSPGEDSAGGLLDYGSELQFTVQKHTSDPALRKTDIDEIGKIGVPFDSSKILHNKVFRPEIAAAVKDRDWKELKVDKLTIQPTTMNVILKGREGWGYDFPREDEEGAPYLKDDKGSVYPYDPSGPGLVLNDGYLQLPFSTSVFFDKDVRKLVLHIGKVTVTEQKPEVAFKLSMNEKFPKTVTFKNQDIVIEGAEYHKEGYLQLKVRKGTLDKKLEKETRFIGEKLPEKSVDEYDEFMRQEESIREGLGIPGYGKLEDNEQSSSFNVYLLAEKKDSYELSLVRSNAEVIVNQDLPIDLQP